MAGPLVPAQAEPPLGRAYELVSPADDPTGSPAGVATNAVAMPGFAARNGDAVVYGAPGSIGSTVNGAPNPLIFGVRDPDLGWSAETVPRTADGGDTGLNVSAGEPVVATVAPDAASVVFGMRDRLTPEANESSVYRIVRGIALPRWIPATDSWPVTSTDLSTVAFNGIVDGVPGVYVLRNGVVELASVLPGGATPVVPFVANNRGNVTATALAALRFQNTLTPDGRFLIFGENPGSGADQNGEASLYVRDLDEHVTLPLAVRPMGAAPFERFYGPSPTLNLGSASGIHAGFVSVAAKAPVAFFRGTTSITTPSINRFYEADLETGDVTFRAAITGPPVRVSDDGRRVLFVRMPDRMTADPFEIRLWDRSTPDSSTLLGTVPRAANSNANASIIRFVRSVNGGDTWVFGAAGSLDPDRPSLNAEATPLQVYRWSIGDAHPTCLSCEPTDGVARFTGANMGVSETNYSESLRKMDGWTNSTQPWVSATPARSASTDGRIVAFDSPDRLTDDDQNDVRDVYLWDADAPTGRELQLVTSGNGESPSFFLDMDEDGRNLFFTTSDGLVPADDDLSYDVYVARVGGGFPEDNPTSCAGEGCRPPVIAPPVFRLPSSTAVAPPSRGARKPVQTGKPKLRVRSVRSSRSRVTVKIITPGSGRIRVSGSRVKTAKRTAKRHTTYTLRVPLRASAKRSVARGKRVKVKLRVAFTPKGEKKASVLRSSVMVRKGR